MINTRALTFASPSDANLRTGQDTLGMFREGSYDSNRFSYFHGKFNSNKIERMSYYNNFIPSGGIMSFPVSDKESAHHPIPFKNALTDKPLPVSDLYHSVLAPTYNPLVA